TATARRTRGASPGLGRSNELFKEGSPAKALSKDAAHQGWSAGKLGSPVKLEGAEGIASHVLSWSISPVNPISFSWRSTSSMINYYNFILFLTEMSMQNSYNGNVGSTFYINDGDPEIQLGEPSQDQLGDASDSSSGPIKSCSQLRTIGDSDSYSSYSDNEVQSKCHQIGNGQVTFRLGQQFSSINDFYEMVKSYAVHNGYELSFTRKDNKRCRAKCLDDCPWLIFCSKVGHLETYEVKTYYEEHNCKKGRMKARFVDAKWLSKKVAGDLSKFPNMTTLELQDHVSEKFNVKISTSKAYRVRNLALHSIDGNQDDQYAKLWDYREELLRTNPGTTFEISAPGNPSRFERLYICIDACKKGFLSGCRPLIAIDGCFLKGYHRGQVLSAVAQDGNNGLFLIAFGVVPLESKETWSWFLHNLLKDIGDISPRGEKWTFISDQGS
ncbi:Unknown protein, partial [Striga hermonthica]